MFCNWYLNYFYHLAWNISTWFLILMVSLFIFHLQDSSTFNVFKLSSFYQFTICLIIARLTSHLHLQIGRSGLTLPRDKHLNCTSLPKKDWICSVGVWLIMPHLETAVWRTRSPAPPAWVWTGWGLGSEHLAEPEKAMRRSDGAEKTRLAAAAQQYFTVINISNSNFI